MIIIIIMICLHMIIWFQVFISNNNNNDNNVKRPDLELINKKEKICHLVDFPFQWITK